MSAPIVISIDPGIRGCGVALFNSGTKLLLRAAYVKNADPKGAGLEEQMEMARCVLFWAFQGEKTGGTVHTLVAEWMQIYPGRGVDPNTSLLPLIGVVAHLSGAYPWRDRVSYQPKAWKGTVDGDVMTDRIQERLTPDELLNIEPCPASLQHNVFDGIGIGLKHLGRLERRRVYAR